MVTDALRRFLLMTLVALATVPVLALRVFAQDAGPVIAGASDLQFALEEIADAFAAETGMRLRLSMGSTGNLSRQIRAGAPFELFLAADESFIADLHADGFTRDEGVLYAIGRLAIMVPNGSALRADPGLDHLAQMLADGTLTRFAIANPEHAPYGMRAREALITRGLWEDIQPFLVMGENVSQAAAFVVSGNVDGGLIAHAHALAAQVAPRGAHALVPDEWHSPLRQRMALLVNAGPVAEAFYAWIQAPKAQAILSRHGFTLPGD